MLCGASFKPSFSVYCDSDTSKTKNQKSWAASCFAEGTQF